LNNNKINEIDEEALPRIQTLKMDNNLITTIPATALTDANHVLSLGGNPLREPFLSMYTEYKDMARVNIFLANNFLRDSLATFWGSYTQRANIAATARNVHASRVLHQNKRVGNTGLVPVIQSYFVDPNNFAMNRRIGKATNATLRKLKQRYNALGHTLPPVEFNVNANAMRRMFEVEGGKRKKRKTLRKRK
jgi:Leucine-rich repeat (LRR) protein